MPTITTLPVSKLSQPITDLLKRGSAKEKKELESHLLTGLRKILSSPLDASSNKELLNAVSGLKGINISADREKTVESILDKTLLPKLKSKELKQQYQTLLSKLPANKKLGDVLRLDKPLKRNPIFKDVARRSIVKEALAQTGLESKSSKISSLLSSIDGKTKFDRSFWSKTVEDKTLTEKEAKEVRNILGLTALTLDNLDLVKALKAKKTDAPEKLASYSKEDFEQLLKKNKIAVPDSFKGDTAVSDYAKYLNAIVEKLYRTKTFVARLPKVDTKQLTSDLTSLDSFLKENPKFNFRRPIKAQKITLPTNPIKKSPEEISRNLASVQPVVNTYRPLVGSIVQDTTVKPETKATLITTEVSKLDTFFNNNPTLDLATSDFFKLSSTDEKTSTINWDGIAVTDQSRITDQLLSFQRVLRISPTVDVSVSLLENGLDSAQRITSYTEDKFIADYAESLELTDDEVSDVYANALTISANVQHQFANIRDLVSPWWVGTLSNNASDDTVEYYSSIPGYDELFGTESLCKCSHCMSIYSPAAYFVDLMRFVDKYITESVTNAGNIPEKLKLKSRRPDLWEIPLDCENTETLIPYIDIVNEVLEDNLGATTDDRSVPYRTLLTAKHPLNLPFNLPLARIRVVLEHFKKRPDEIYDAFGKDEIYIASEYLQISHEERSLFLTSTTNDADLIERYGLQGVSSLSDGTFGGLIEVETFLAQVGLSRSELDDLLYQNLEDVEINDTEQANFYINNIDGTSYLDVQTEVDGTEKFVNLSNKKLDRIHRFLRFARKLGWTYEELDWVLRTLGVDGTTDISEDTIEKLALVKEWKERFKVALDVLNSFWYPIKHIGKRNDEGDDPLDLYNRTFNTPDLLETGDEWVLDATTGTIAVNGEPVTLDTADPTDSNRTRLLAALAVRDEDLSLLLDSQWLPAGSLAEGSTVLTLTHQLVSHLYRMARFPKLLKLRVDEFLVLLELMGISSIDSFENLEAIVETIDWMNDADLGIYDAQYMITGELNDFVDAGYTDEDVQLLTEEIETALATNFVTASAFLAIEGMTEESAHEIYDDLVTKGHITNSESGGTLTSKFTPDVEGFTLDLPSLYDESGTYDSETDAEVVAILQQFDRKQIILDKLANFYGETPALLELIMEFASKTLDDEALVTLLSTAIEEEEDIPEDLDAALRAIHNRQFIVNEFELDQDELELLLSNPEYFSISSTTAPTLGDLEGLALYQSITARYHDTENTLLEYFTETDKTTRLDILAELTDWDATQITMLADLFWPDATDTGYATIDGVDRLKQCFDISTYLGVNIDSLQSWAELVDVEDYDDYDSIANALIETVKAKYTEDEWEEKYEPMNDKVREMKRDALSYYALWNLDKDWTDDIPPLEELDDLYQYLLVDVEMSSCADVSRIKLGIGTVQLYIYRCLMNLEQGIDPASIDADYWEWMKNYRVWEANRKVFVYPENYLEPELRDDKTPIFEELEDELLQQDITDDNVEMSYRNYLKKLDEQANIQIAGNYYETDDEGNTILHLFGRSNVEPHNYFYRRYENETTWTPWEKVEVTINAEKVSPIKAWGRMFLFWTEVSRRDVDSDEVEEDVVKISFTFLDTNDKWMQPQTLLEKSDFSSDLSDTEKSAWSRVYPRFDGETIFIDYGYVSEASSSVLTLDYDSLATLGKSYYQLYPSLLYEEGELFFVENAVEEMNMPVKYGGMPYLYEETRYPDTINYYQSATSILVRKELTLPEVPGDTILETVTRSKTSVKAVNSKDDWFLFHPGEEEFLIERTSGLLRQGVGLTNAQLATNILTLGAAFSREFATSKSKTTSADMLPGIPSSKFTGVNGSLVVDDQYDFARISTSCLTGLAEILFADGIEEFLTLDTQKNVYELDFERYSPTSLVGKEPFSEQQLDFDGAYGIYFKELFFHTPFLIADALNGNQKFEEAQQWYHYIFNPTITEAEEGGSRNDRFWQYLPFRGLNQESLEDMLTDDEAIEAYHDDPFNPHAIARLRLTTYPKAVVMKYIDNLIDWGDYLFAQDTWETITEATMLYVMAANLLGKKPDELPECEQEEVLTYQQIYDQYVLSGEEIPEFLISLENTDAAYSTSYSGYGTYSESNLVYYFCIPDNEQLTEYWDTVEDRLYKIRNCMNISGEKRALALFEPPINPMALVRAAAAGRDIGSVLSEVLSPLPYYRFNYMIEKARAFVSMTQQYGNALLSALEKKDAEELSLLRSTNEKVLLGLTTKTKEKQIDEAEETLSSLDESKESAKRRKKYYDGLIKKGYISEEQSQLKNLEKANTKNKIADITTTVASFTYLIPQMGSPFSMNFGGRELGTSAEAVAVAFRITAAARSLDANMNSIIGGFKRRSQEWELQSDVASREINQIDKQINAAKVRKEILQKEKEIHEKTIEQRNEEYVFLKDKFTNKELYQWMTGQLAGLYFQAYKMAYNMAKAAEKTFQLERSTSDIYINFGHWDSLKKGLLAGERLMLELHQMEKAYIDDNKREFEVEKTIALSQLNPAALYELKTSGTCAFSLREEVFDRDFPGQYCRKVKSVSISIPAVVGPYENIKATLKQLNNKVLLTADTDALLIEGNLIELDPENTNVRSDWRPNEKIAISRGVNDSGMFELNFRDERYLPFEGTGVISEWELEMPKGSNHFDFDSISDVIVHLKYTSLFDGGLRDYIYQNYTTYDGFRIMSLRHEYSTEWHYFLNPEAGAKEHTLSFDVTEKILPFNLSSLEIKQLLMGMTLEDDTEATLTLTLQPADAQEIELTLENEDLATSEELSDGDNAFGEWVLTIDRKDGIPASLRKTNDDGSYKTETIDGETYYYLDPDKLKNMTLILSYIGTIEWPTTE